MWVPSNPLRMGLSNADWPLFTLASPVPAEIVAFGRRRATASARRSTLALPPPNSPPRLATRLPGTLLVTSTCTASLATAAFDALAMKLRRPPALSTPPTSADRLEPAASASNPLSIALALAKDVAWAELWSPHKAPWEALSSAATSATRCRLRCSR